MKNEPYHILLADDDKSDRMLFIDAFSELKIETNVQTFNDGIQLMDWLNKENINLPEFIFLDLNMPRKNGLECLKEIKSNEKFKGIFIAIYSTSDNEDDIDETFLNGANVYISKPTSFSSLKKVLEKVVITAYLYKDQFMIRENFLLRL